MLNKLGQHFEYADSFNLVCKAEEERVREIFHLLIQNIVSSVNIETHPNPNNVVIVVQQITVLKGTKTWAQHFLFQYMLQETAA